MIKICDKKMYYTTGELARLVGVTTPTVCKWIKEGRIFAYKTLGGRSRIGRDEINKIIDKFVEGNKK